jgi:quinol monooxygenase YgiN
LAKSSGAKAKGQTGVQQNEKPRKRENKMATLTIVANITAKEGQIDMVKAELLKLIDITRNEPGCINYDLHQDNDNPAHFLFYENWKSRELWQSHMSNQHLTDYMDATEDAVAEFVINEMTPVA